ncbi:response regulator receiver sensor signal transduction histidine kinase [Paraburkholderia sp. GV068]|jgi:signal transduction histidine kinase|uniref:histidine kinase n=1 Tax=Paraburkholderia graminis (strain ATCC 700544 / DSM 17151 / LMG 18924 / NCIMB 13744 / C4D1M) TaxID=396598 RepID=B1FTQ3_PARG4|nr:MULTISPECIES: hybrid sensor histidine kinase/response regulator [Paraburkholderia]EDT13061.1 response regulator receiver sensor signal transduction histidine kinase [Paraburkholderia graminis C4D1M]MDR6476021.1 signal transduction histidine kinase [Paraburkholderia graminis]PTQ95364.1 response regulator receiver sensor signal transduction histidine kinase [Paraburkholderia sp. GV072]PUB02018.1 response regulator receiver sensor signal transduction histidine kinase [Paraburkholderia sp. GV068
MSNSPVNILIVDDIAHNITALKALLTRPDVAVLVADSGTAALDLLLKHEVALAILDVNMPGMNGFELAALMRGSPRTSHVPIIFLTATAQDASRTFRGYEAGAVDFLYKPFDPRILQSKVDVFVQLEQQKRQLAAQLVTTRQMLEANEMLMAVLSHDLRTPLGAVLASAEYLMRTAADQQSATVAARVKNSSLRMARMVDQLLNLARLQGGRLPLQPRSIELATLCRSVIDEFASRENGKRILFTSRGNTAGAWDTDLVWQAVSNLVSNALHHGAAGDVNVEVDGEAADFVRLKVANRGVIPPEVFPHLFKAFGPNNNGSRSREGLGLGLHIVHEIARMHGGTVDVKSDESGGTVFTIELPRMVTLQRGSFSGR